MKHQKEIYFQVEEFFDDLFQNTQKLLRVTRWLDYLTWLILIGLVVSVIGSIQLLFTVLNQFPIGDVHYGKSLALMNPLEVISYLDTMGFRLIPILRMLAFYATLILLLPMIKQMIYLVFDIKNATKTQKLIQ
jgi:hypothetical protein